MTIRIDYSIDDVGSKFFGSGNPQGLAAGMQAKAALDAAAAFYSGILDDTLSAIQEAYDTSARMAASPGVEDFIS